AVGSLLIMTGMVTVSVVLRKAFNYPLNFTQEYSQYLTVLIIYFSAAFTTRAGDHISVKLVVTRLPKKVRNILDVVTLFLALLVMGLYL
ncbi:unnamed protein product, partial [marine sediment metagenome]